jgi:hypothetical protein
MSGGRWIVLALVCALSGAGCGGSKFKTTYPARGQVLCDGKPVTGIKVVLISQEDNDPLVRPSGTVDADGRFELSTYASGDGAPAGSYTVTIMAPLPEPKGQAGTKAASKPPAPPTLPVSARYSKPETSGLTVVVEAKDNELPPLTVTK